MPGDAFRSAADQFPDITLDRSGADTVTVAALSVRSADRAPELEAPPADSIAMLLGGVP